MCLRIFFFFSSRRRHTRLQGDWSSDVCSSDLYDIAVVEPGHGYDPVQFRKQAPGSELYAYASVAEVLPERAYFSKIPEAWKMARNGAWQSIVLDQTPAQWPAFFADEVDRKSVV